MKKVLVTGAAGAIGLSLIKYLLTEGKYEITALDLKNRKVFRRLHKYHKRVNVIYGDILDRALVDNLVKDQDIIINLSSILPPVVEYKKNLANVIEYTGTENLVRAITYYNPKCYFIYASSTNLYNENPAKVSDKIEVDKDNIFAYAKYKTEKLIQKKVKHYTIVRVPLVLSDLQDDPFIYTVNKNDMVEVITKEDAAYALVSCIDNYSKISGRILNIGGGVNSTIMYRTLLYNIVKYHGLSWRFVLSSWFLPKTYTSPVCEDTYDSNKILKYQNDSLQSYYMRQKRRSKKRKFSLLLGKVYLLFNKGKVSK